MSCIPAKAILRFIGQLEREGVNMHAFELRQHGVLRAEGYYAPFAKGQPHRMYSVSKSMVSLAVGMLWGDGRLDLDSCITQHFPEYLPSSPDERLLRLTIRDMLRMATCYRGTTYREGIDQDWASTFFTAAASHEPGCVFHYDTSCSQVLGALVEKISGQKLLSFLNQRLFERAGTQDPIRWLTDPSGVAQGGTGLIMSLRDLAKVAQLVMDGGRDIIPQAYIDQATAWQIETPLRSNPEELHGYGWQFWRTRDGWSMYGMGGQLAIAHPASGVLLCTLADTRLDPYGVQRIYNAFFDGIIAGMNDEQTAEDEALLQRRLADLRVPALPHAAGASVPCGLWRIASNDAGLEQVEITQNSVRLHWAHAVHVYHWESFGQLVQTEFDHVPALVSAGAVCDGTLGVQCHLIGDAPCGMGMRFAAKGDHITVLFKRSSDPHTAGYDGVFWGVRY